MSEVKSKDFLQSLAQKTQQRLTREKWLAALRSQPERQCEGWGRRRTHQACAIQMLWQLTGSHFNWSYERIGAEAGLSDEQICTVIEHNDGVHASKMTFSEIADRIEVWF